MCLLRWQLKRWRSQALLLHNAMTHLLCDCFYANSMKKIFVYVMAHTTRCIQGINCSLTDNTLGRKFKVQLLTLFVFSTVPPGIRPITESNRHPSIQCEHIRDCEQQYGQVRELLIFSLFTVTVIVITSEETSQLNTSG